MKLGQALVSTNLTESLSSNSNVVSQTPRSTGFCFFVFIFSDLQRCKSDISKNDQTCDGWFFHVLSFTFCRELPWIRCPEDHWPMRWRRPWSFQASMKHLVITSAEHVAVLVCRGVVCRGMPPWSDHELGPKGWQTWVLASLLEDFLKHRCESFSHEHPSHEHPSLLTKFNTFPFVFHFPLLTKALYASEFVQRRSQRLMWEDSCRQRTGLQSYT